MLFCLLRRRRSKAAYGKNEIRRASGGGIQPQNGENPPFSCLYGLINRREKEPQDKTGDMGHQFSPDGRQTNRRNRGKIPTPPRKQLRSINYSSENSHILHTTCTK